MKTIIPALMNSWKKLIGGRTGRYSLCGVVVAGALVGGFLWSRQSAADKSPAVSDRGMDQLKSLVATSSGHPSESDLIAIASRYPKTRAGSLATFLRGYLHYSGKDYGGAIPILDSDRTAYSSIGDYDSYYRAESEAAAGRNADAVRDFKIVASAFPDSLLGRQSETEGAQALLAEGDGAGALRTISRLAAEGDPDAQLIAGQAYERLGRTSEAVQAYRKLYYGTPASIAADRAYDRLQILSASEANRPATPAELRSRAEGLYASKQFSEASKEYNELASLGGAALTAEDLLNWGVSLLEAKQFANAAATLGRVGSSSSKLEAEALYHQAEAFRRMGQLSNSAASVDRLAARYKESRWAPMALYDLADYLDKHDTAAASARYAQLESNFAGSEYAAEASYRLGWRAYSERRYSDAANLLEQHLAEYRYPESKHLGEAGYWAGRAEERLGHEGRALALYQYVSQRYLYGYDGYVASRRAEALKRPDSHAEAESPASGSELDRIRQNLTAVTQVGETADGSEKARVDRAEDLEAIGLTDFAIKELNRALEHSPSSPRLCLRLAQIYYALGDTLQATIVLRKAYPDLFSYKDSDLPREAWEIFFPLKYWVTIKEEARKHGIDPYVAAGLIRQESVFNPNAISRVGARGLMQLMTPTGQLVAKREGEGRITAADLYNPTINIKLGMAYLADMIGQFGKIEYAAAAYNAGPGRARQWIAERGNLDMDEWVQSIPLTETRGYVQGVLRNAANYRRLYPR